MCIHSYKINKVDGYISVDLAYFHGDNRKDKKPLEIINIKIELLTLDNQNDILKLIYNKLNNISPLKEYYEQNGEV
jgi:hypothetical protein